MTDLPGFTELVTGILMISTPILLAAIGGYVTQRAGIYNIGIEGFMLGGAFAAAITTYYVGHTGVGLLASVASGITLSALMGFVVISLKVDQFVAGLALNALTIGLAVYLLVTLFGQEQSLTSDRIKPLPRLRELGIDRIPGIGPALGAQTPLVVMAFGSVVAISLLLSRTTVGLHIRSVGDAPEAARAAGVSVARTQYLAFLISGGLAGLAGAQLSIGQLSLFFIGMTAGRGIIAFAAVIAGGARIGFVALAAVLFGVAEESAIVLTGSDFPEQVVQMTPYLLAIAAVTVAGIIGGRRSSPLLRRRSVGTEEVAGSPPVPGNQGLVEGSER